MPIRYPIAFRGTARPSVCSAWRLKVPKIELLTHPKPYIVPKTFDCFSLICSSRNPISCRNPILCRNLSLISALFAHSETLYRAETRYFAETFCLFQPYLLKAKPYIVPKTRCFAETFCLFQPYLFKSKPSFLVELGAVVHQRETSARFRHQRNLQAFFVTFCLFAF